VLSLSSLLPRLGDQRKMLSCLIYPECNWTEHVFVFDGIDLIFFDVIGLGKSKFLFFEANKAIRQDLGNLARFWQRGKILAIRKNTRRNLYMH